jgi:hypothetical protein
VRKTGRGGEQNHTLKAFERFVWPLIYKPRGKIFFFSDLLPQGSFCNNLWGGLPEVSGLRNGKKSKDREGVKRFLKPYDCPLGQKGDVRWTKRLKRIKVLNNG